MDIGETMDIIVFKFPWTADWVVSVDNEIEFSFTTRKLAIETALLIQRVAKGVFHTDMKVIIEES